MRLKKKSMEPKTSMGNMLDIKKRKEVLSDHGECRRDVAARNRGLAAN